MSILTNKNNSKGDTVMEAIGQRASYEYSLPINKKLQRAIDKKKKKMSKDERQLLNEINEAYREMATSFAHFECATDPALIEYYTYKYKADQIKYDYLIRCMKQLRHPS